MENDNLHSELIHVPVVSTKKESNDNYALLLDSFDVRYTEDLHYLQVGVPKLSQGWLLHISVVVDQGVDLILKVIPELLALEFPFRIIKSKKLHSSLNKGHFGAFKIGKVITVMIDQEVLVDVLMQRLVPIAAQYIGPAILTDFKLSDNIFTRYGTFIPVYDTDGFGNRVRLLKDSNGRYFLDQYYAPPIQMPGFPTPFQKLTAQNAPPKQKLLNGKYVMLKLIKSDTKGDVWLAQSFNKFFIPTQCIIKQGRQGMFPDEFGRDIRDRLQWQQELYSYVKDLVLTPEVIECFEEDGQLYLVTSYVKSSSMLAEYIGKIFGQQPWFTQPIGVKERTLNLLIQVGEGIEVLHSGNIVHRDITGTNFLVDKRHQIHYIDLELLVHLQINKPNPPFGLGTFGYMSKQQAKGLPPDKTDDYFSMGALIMMAFTGGMEPYYLLELENYELLKERLVFFTRNSAISTLIVQCLGSIPERRPTIQMILTELKKTQQTISNSTVSIDKPYRYNTAFLQSCIQRSIDTLGKEIMTDQGRWFSSVENNFGYDVYSLGDKYVYTGMYRGVGGVIWLLSSLQDKGYSLSTCNKNLEKGINWLLGDVELNFIKMAQSYYYGKAGVAVMLVKCMNNNMIPNLIEIRELVFNCFKNRPNNLGILVGVAGQGIALLKCRDCYESGTLNTLLNEYASLVLDEQLPDGSWLVNKALDYEGEKITNFGDGAAGITYFLLELYRHTQENTILNSVNKALAYLQKEMKSIDKSKVWPTSDKNESWDFWFFTGSSGIALTFLRAYEITKNENWLTIALDCLSSIPEYFMHERISLGEGITGIGEVYLEAYRILQDEKWLTRAEWIAQQLISFRKEDSNIVYWLVDKKDFPTADLMAGCGGILHFLANVEHPINTNFPLL